MARRTSRREPPDHPAFALFARRVRDAVMQAAGPSLPELEVVGQHAVAAPVRWPRRILAVFVGELRPARLQPCPILERAALRRGPGTDARSQWSRAVVRVRF